VTLKQDELGAGVETTVPRPVEDGAPRSYRPTVLRTRRIPVDPGDLRSQLDRLIRQERPELVRWLDKAFVSSQRDVSFDELASALTTGNVDGPYIARWRQRYAELVREKIVPAWMAAQTSGSRVMIPGIEGFLGDDVAFALLGERMDAWTRERAASLVVGLTENQRTALAAMVRQFTTFDRRGPREVARFIRPLIGMTPRDSEALAKQGRDRLAAGESVDSIKRDLANQALTRIRRRAETIAETELAYAYNFGTWHTVREAQEEGAFGADIVVKRWWSQLDERLCSFCGPLHDTVIGMEETFPGKTPLVPNTFAPPAHPRCRCALLYEVVDVDEAIAPPVETSPPGAVPGPDGEPVVYAQPLTEAEFGDVLASEQATLRRELGVDVDALSAQRATMLTTRQAWMEAKPFSLERNAAFREYTRIKDELEANTEALIQAFERLLGDERSDPEYIRRSKIDTFGAVRQPQSGDHVLGERYNDVYRAQPAKERKETAEYQRDMAALFRRSLPPETVRQNVQLEVGAVRKVPRAYQQERVDKGWHESGGQARVAVNVGDNVKRGEGRRVVYHELGHTLEILNGRVADASRIFFERRTRGEALAWLGPGYAKSEKAKKDKWYTSYVGKEYYSSISEDSPKTRASEVVSMGIETLADPKRMAELAMADFEHLAFAFAIQRGRFGWRP